MSVNSYGRENTNSVSPNSKWAATRPSILNNHLYLESEEDESLNRESFSTMPEPLTTLQRSKPTSISSRKSLTFIQSPETENMDQGYITSNRQMVPYNECSYGQDPHTFRPNSNHGDRLQGNQYQIYGEPQHQSFFNLGHQIVQLSETVANAKDCQRKIISFSTLWEKADSIVSYLKKGIYFHSEYDTLIQRGSDILKGCFKNRTYMKKKEFLHGYRSCDPASEMDLLNFNLDSLRAFNAELTDRISSHWPGGTQRPFAFQTGQALEKLRHWKDTSSTISVRFDELLEQLELWFSNFHAHFHQQIEDNVKNPFTTKFPHFKELDHVANDLVASWNGVPVLCSVAFSLACELQKRISKVNALLEIGVKLNLDFSAKVYSDANNYKGKGRHHNREKIKRLSESHDEPDEDGISLLEFVSKSRQLSPQFKKDICSDILKELKGLHDSWTSYKYLNPANVIIHGNASVSLRPSDSCMKYEPLPPWVFKSPCVDGGDSSNTQKTRNPWTADVYSFGQIVLWLVSLEGDNFYAGSLSSLRQSCPIIDSALDSNPLKRPNMLQLEEALPSIFDKLWNTDDRSSSNHQSSTPPHPAREVSAQTKRHIPTKTPETISAPVDNQNGKLPPMRTRPKPVKTDTKTPGEPKPRSQNGPLIDVDRSNHYEKQMKKDFEQIVIKHKIAESIFQDSDGESVDLDYLQNDIFEDESPGVELFSEGELSDPNSEFAQLVESKLKIALSQPEKLVA